VLGGHENLLKAESALGGHEDLFKNTPLMAELP
jgi:hypothetical protein